MNMQELRKEIDAINEELIALLGKRLDVAKKIARVKKAEALPVLDTQREQNQLGKIRELAKRHNLSPAIVEEMFDLFIDYTRFEMALEMEKNL